MADPETPKHVPWAARAARQLKLILPGGLLTYYIGVLEEFWRTIHGLNGPLGRTGALGAGGLGLTTVILFFYILLMPILTGEESDFRAWRQTPTLSTIIPLLTASIVIGWLLAVTTLGQWSNLGYIRAIIGVSAVYTLTFGLLALIPAPKANRKPKRKA